MPDGWIILDKPVGLGSTQAVAAVKRVLRASGRGMAKVGHGGTLDPLASGVLPIALGEATKLAGRMLDATKDYVFTIAFGIETDTLDREGVAVDESAARPTLGEIEAVLPRFTGAIDQTPPAFSAVKIEGRRAYHRARAGEAVAMPARRVTVHRLSVPPSTSGSGMGASPWASSGGETRFAGRSAGEGQLHSVSLVAHVSKGTYIRSLARDIARAVGSVGHVAMLCRTRAGPFGLDQGISLDNLDAIGHGALLENILLPLEAGLDDIPALDLGPEQARAVRQGRVLTGLAFQDGVCWARSGGMPVALMELAGGDARVLRGFNLPDVAE